jgi:spermidine synthase
MCVTLAAVNALGGDDWILTKRGELVLRQRDGVFEIISNGMFLMDTADGSSERLLVDAALARCDHPAPRVLIGGLGVGFSLAQAATHARVAAIDVVEIEPMIIDWYARHLDAGPRDDPRVRIVEADVVEWLERPDDPYDVICLDTDNGPNWLVTEGNAAIYSEAGIERALNRLRPGGVLAVWSASRDMAYERRLRARAANLEVLRSAHRRGEPDVIYVART